MIPIVTLVLAIAAPVPKDKTEERIGRLIGTPTRGDKADEFRLDGERLTIRIPSGERRKRIEGRPLEQVPRVERTVSGDFEMTVKVVDCTGIQKTESESAYIDAGLFIISKDQTRQSIALHLRHNYYSKPRIEANPNAPKLWVDIDPGDGMSVDPNSQFPRDNVFLRLTRTGKNLTIALSDDGKTWAEPTAFKDAKLSEEVTVGLFVAQVGHEKEVIARFEQFMLTQPKSENK